MELLLAYGWALGIVVILLLWQGSLLNAIAVIPGHFILKMLGVEKQFANDDKKGELSVAVGYIFIAAVWLAGNAIYRWYGWS
jgi:hypothetical protein